MKGKGSILIRRARLDANLDEFGRPALGSVPLGARSTILAIPRAPLRAQAGTELFEGVTPYVRRSEPETRKPALRAGFRSSG